MVECRLPPELWIQIFRWATAPAEVEPKDVSTFMPFQSVKWNVPLRHQLSTKRTLVLVCRQWRHLGIKFLYEVIVLRHHVQALEQALRRGYGKWVRVAELVCACHNKHRNHLGRPAVSQVTEILRLCPNLRTLTRPATVDPCVIELHPAHFPLPSLHHVFWWNPHFVHGVPINSLLDVLGNSPNVRYLAVGGDAYLPDIHGRLLHLPHLTTLRLRRLSSSYLWQVARWSLPNLAHVVLEVVSLAQSLDSLWDAFGHQLHTIELGCVLRFLVDDRITSILKQCPNLRVLNYYINFTSIPENPFQHSLLKQIGLHAAQNSFDAHLEWRHLEQHFTLFAHPGLPALEKVVLYGDWGYFIYDPRFRALLEPLDSKICIVELEDGTRLNG
jgi:hypothetical protein